MSPTRFYEVRGTRSLEHRRSTSWLKFKCVNEQEFVIGGYTDPKGFRTGFGALLLGYYEDGTLVYAGKVGTGFDNETLRQMSKQLGSMERQKALCSGTGVPRRRRGSSGRRVGLRESD